jgi:hypothetical protein
MRDARQIWDRLVEDAGEDAIGEAIGVSVADAERELVAADFDTKAERARAAVIMAQLTGERHLTAATEGASREDPPVDGPADSAVWVRGTAPAEGGPRASRSWVWLAAALAAAATTGGILYAVGHRSKPQDNPVEPPREVPSAPSATASAAPVSPTASSRPDEPTPRQAGAASPGGPTKVPGYNAYGKPDPKGR